MSNEAIAHKISQLSVMDFNTQFRYIKSLATKDAITYIENMWNTTNETSAHIGRLVRSAKRAEGGFYSIMTLLVMDDYTYGREVMKRVDSGKIDDDDSELSALIRDVSLVLRFSFDPSVVNLLVTQGTYVINRITEVCDKMDLVSGFFSRNQVPIKHDYEKMMTHYEYTREKNSVCRAIGERNDTYKIVLEELRAALNYALNIRLFIMACIPTEIQSFEVLEQCLSS